jgi:hypothetical protein
MFHAFGITVKFAQDFDDFRLDFLGEYEALCEMALARQLGPLVGLFDEKTESKISSHSSFKCTVQYGVKQLTDLTVV